MEKEWTAEIEDEHLHQFEDYQSGACPDGAPPPSGQTLNRALDSYDDSQSEEQADSDHNDEEADDSSKPNKRKSPGTPKRLQAMEARSRINVLRSMQITTPSRSCPRPALRLSPKQAVETVDDVLDQLFKVQGRIAASIPKLAGSKDKSRQEPLDSMSLTFLDFVAARMCNPTFQLRAYEKMMARQTRIMKLHDDVAELKAHFDSHRELDDGHPVRSRSSTSKIICRKHKNMLG